MPLLSTQGQNTGYTHYLRFNYEDAQRSSWRDGGTATAAEKTVAIIPAGGVLKDIGFAAKNGHLVYDVFTPDVIQITGGPFYADLEETEEVQFGLLYRNGTDSTGRPTYAGINGETLFYSSGYWNLQTTNPVSSWDQGDGFNPMSPIGLTFVPNADEVGNPEANECYFATSVDAAYNNIYTNDGLLANGNFSNPFPNGTTQIKVRLDELATSGDYTIALTILDTSTLA